MGETKKKSGVRKQVVTEWDGIRTRKIWKTIPKFMPECSCRSSISGGKGIFSADEACRAFREMVINFERKKKKSGFSKRKRGDGVRSVEHYFGKFCWIRRGR